MLFQDYESGFENYDGEDLSAEIGDQWQNCWCDCPVECEECKCKEQDNG